MDKSKFTNISGFWILEENACPSCGKNYIDNELYWLLCLNCKGKFFYTMKGELDWRFLPRYGKTINDHI